MWPRKETSENLRKGKRARKINRIRSPAPRWRNRTTYNINAARILISRRALASYPRTLSVLSVSASSGLLTVPFSSRAGCKSFSSQHGISDSLHVFRSPPLVSSQNGIILFSDRGFPSSDTRVFSAAYRSSLHSSASPVLSFGRIRIDSENRGSPTKIPKFSSNLQNCNVIFNVKNNKNLF